MPSGVTNNPRGCPPGKGWKLGFGKFAKQQALPESEYKSMHVKTLAQMSEEEIQALERAYGAPVKRPVKK